MRGVKAKRPALGMLFSASLVAGMAAFGLVAAPTASAGCYESEIRYGICRDDRDFSRDYDRVYYDRDRYDRCGYDRCGYDRRVTFEAHWDFDRQNCRDDAFWVSYGNGGFWVDPIHDPGYRLEVIPNGGPFPWVNWVPV